MSNTRSRSAAFLSSAAIVLALSACGGGGGGSGGGSSVGSSVFATPVAVLATPQLPNMKTVCTTATGSVTADANGVSPASSALQSCLDGVTGTWTIPEGTYQVDAALTIHRAIQINAPGVTWKASKSIVGTGNGHTMVFSGYMSSIEIRGLTLDGNIAERHDAAFCNGTTAAYAGGNIHFDHVDDVVIDGVTTKNAVCGSGMHFSGKRARITNSTFADNGYHRANHWADGLTLLNCDSCMVADNRFVNNSDVGLVMGGGEYSRIERNIFTQTTPVFAALSLDNFNGSTTGDFVGTVLTSNTIECNAFMCDFGINLGPHAWYPSANIRGGIVSWNYIRGAKIGIVAGGAGTTHDPLMVWTNEVTGSPEEMQTFQCGSRPAGPRIYSSDSVLNTRGEKNFVIGDHKNCP